MNVFFFGHFMVYLICSPLSKFCPECSDSACAFLTPFPFESSLTLSPNQTLPLPQKRMNISNNMEICLFS